MGFTNYKQADSRWGSKNYNGSSTMAAAGCGPTSCAIVLSGLDPDITPVTTMKYMQTHGDKDHATFALRGQGTAWNGIPSCLKFYGMADVQEVDVSTSMSKVWELMNKDHVGVFLFSAGSRNGVTWTTSGHYVAVTDLKEQDGNHYVYTRDPGGRDHTGSYSYEKYMRGLVYKVWLGVLKEIQPVPKPLGKYGGSIPSPTLKRGSSGTAVKELQRFLNWYCGVTLKDDGKLGAKTEQWLMVFQKSEGLSHDGVYGTQSYLKALSYTDQTINGRVLISMLDKKKVLTLATDMVGQSLAVVDASHRYVFYANRAGTAQMCKLYNGTDLVGKKASYTTLGHANGATQDGKYFYVCMYSGSKNTKKVAKIDMKSFNRTGVITSKVALSGIAYDMKKKLFVGSKGKTIYVFKDAQLKSYTKFTLKYADGTPQDIFADGGYVYVCRSYVFGSYSAIDKYTYTGTYVGSYVVTGNELESAAIDENSYIHYITWNKAQLVRTGVRS